METGVKNGPFPRTAHEVGVTSVLVIESGGGHLGISDRKWSLGVLAVHATKISTHSLPFCTPQPRFRSRYPPRLIRGSRCTLQDYLCIFSSRSLSFCTVLQKTKTKHLFTDMFFLKTHLFTFLLQRATKTHLPINTLVLLHFVTKTRLFINKCFPFALCEKSVTTWNEVKIKSSGQSPRIALLRNAVWSWKIIWPIDLFKISNPNPHQKFTASPPV